MVLRRCRGEVTRDQQPEAFRYDEAAPPSENPYFAGSLYSRYDVPWRVSAAVTQSPRCGKFVRSDRLIEISSTCASVPDSSRT